MSQALREAFSAGVQLGLQNTPAVGPVTRIYEWKTSSEKTRLLEE